MNPLTVDAVLQSLPLIIPEAVLCLAACAWFLLGTWVVSRNVWAAASLVALLVAQVVVWLTPELTFQSAEQARAALYSAPIWGDHFTVHRLRPRPAPAPEPPDLDLTGPTAAT